MIRRLATFFAVHTFFLLNKSFEQPLKAVVAKSFVRIGNEPVLTLITRSVAASLSALVADSATFWQESCFRIVNFFWAVNTVRFIDIHSSCNSSFLNCVLIDFCFGCGTEFVLKTDIAQYSFAIRSANCRACGLR